PSARLRRVPPLLPVPPQARRRRRAPARPRFGHPRRARHDLVARGPTTVAERGRGRARAALARLSRAYTEPPQRGAVLRRIKGPRRRRPSRILWLVCRLPGTE